jgi:hypothetical protein
MDRLAVISLALVATAAWAKPPATKKPSTAKHAAPGLHLRSIDLVKRYAMVELSGVSRAPAPNLFIFTDDRERHYVAMNASCDPPFPSGARVCELEIPAGYERHKLVSLELHLGGLHSRTIAAPESEVAAAWAAAEAARPNTTETPLAPSPRPSPRPSPSPSPRPGARRAP